MVIYSGVNKYTPLIKLLFNKEEMCIRDRHTTILMGISQKQLNNYFYLNYILFTPIQIMLNTVIIVHFFKLQITQC